MRLDRVRDGLGLPAPPGDSGADLRVRALDLMRDRLADVVEQRAPARGRDRRAELARHEPGELGALDEVVEHVLAVARAELQLPEELHQLGVEPVHACLERRALALLDDPLVRSRPWRARSSPRRAPG